MRGPAHEQVVTVEHLFVARPIFEMVEGQNVIKRGESLVRERCVERNAGRRLIDDAADGSVRAPKILLSYITPARRVTLQVSSPAVSGSGA